MAHTKSAIKRYRQSLKRRARNRAARSQIKTVQTKLSAAIAGKDSAQANALLQRYFSILDKSVKRGIIKKGQADRRKSRMALRVRAAFATAPAPSA